MLQVVYFMVVDVIFVELIDGDRLHLLIVLLPRVDTYNIICNITQYETRGRERERERERERNSKILLQCM